MQACGERIQRPIRHSLPIAVGLLPLTALPALAQATALDSDPRMRLIALGLVIFVLLAFMSGSFFLLRRLANHARETAMRNDETAATYSGRFFDMPLGVPEGSVRSLVSVFIILFGFMILVLQKPLGMNSGEAITGFIGTVITFYFASRTTEQSRALVEDAKAAVDRAGQAAANAGAAANTASAAATDAGTAARNVGSSVVAAGVGGMTPEQQSRLNTLRDTQGKLQALRQLISVAGSFGAGTGAVAGADRALARVDGLLTKIGPVISGGASVESVGALAEEAGNALRDLGNLGPVGNAVSDAMATVGRVAQQSSPIASVLTGILGGGALAGPAGLVAAVVVGGLQLVREKEKFDRWKAAMLDTPLDLGLLPATVDGGLAAAALQRAPLLAGKLGAVDPAMALALWEAVGSSPARMVPAREAAQAVLGGSAAGDGAARLRDAFAGNPDALADAIEDFRTAMTGAAALQGLDMPRIAVAGAEVNTLALAGAVRVARQDSRVAAELERMVFMVEALGKADPATLASVSAQIATPDFLRSAEAEATAKTRSADQASTAPAGGA